MKKTGVLLAATVGILFTTTILADDMSNMSQANNQFAAKGDVKCAGINSCKGKGACKANGNSCKGQNNCKGQGVTMMKSEKDCTDKGGTVQSNS